MMRFPIVILLATVIYPLSLIAQVQNPERLDPRWQTDTTRHIVDLHSFIALMPRDGFAVIDSPLFVGKAKAENVFVDEEPVISVEINGVARAYPQNILTYHEMAIDQLGEIPILITYCPLCNSGIVFDRRLEIGGREKTLTFGVSGMLRNSDMVMWDKQTESWWQQLTGQALVGTLAGKELTMIPSQILSVAQFFERYPEGLMMGRKQTVKGAEDEYGSNPYLGYDGISKGPKRFFQAKPDSRLPAMTRIVEITLNGKHRVYPFPLLKKYNVINDYFEGCDVVLFYRTGIKSILDSKNIRKGREIGMVTVFKAVLDGTKRTFKKKEEGFVDEQSGSIWDVTGRCIAGAQKGRQLRIMPHSQHFAFAWLAFYPESEIFENR